MAASQSAANFSSSVEIVTEHRTMSREVPNE
jgi:hypothetical protein